MGALFIVNFIDILTDALPQVSVSMFYDIRIFIFNNVSEIEKDTCNKFFKGKVCKKDKDIVDSIYSMEYYMDGIYNFNNIYSGNIKAKLIL